MVSVRMWTPPGKVLETFLWAFVSCRFAEWNSVGGDIEGSDVVVGISCTPWGKEDSMTKQQWTESFSTSGDKFTTC